jgi:hypothetical protein
MPARGERTSPRTILAGSLVSPLTRPAGSDWLASPRIRSGPIGLAEPPAYKAVDVNASQARRPARTARVASRRSRRYRATCSLTALPARRDRAVARHPARRRPYLARPRLQEPGAQGGARQAAQEGRRADRAAWAVRTRPRRRWAAGRRHPVLPAPHVRVTAHRRAATVTTGDRRGARALARGARRPLRARHQRDAGKGKIVPQRLIREARKRVAGGDVTRRTGRQTDAKSANVGSE